MRHPGQFVNLFFQEDCLTRFRGVFAPRDVVIRSNLGIASVQAQVREDVESLESGLRAIDMSLLFPLNGSASMSAKLDSFVLSAR